MAVLPHSETKERVVIEHDRVDCDRTFDAPGTHRLEGFSDGALPPTVFAGQVLRPAVGIALYGAAVAVGWLAHPLFAVGIIIVVVGYYAWTSQGI
jgi:hypothetical protein